MAIADVHAVTLDCLEACLVESIGVDMGAWIYPRRGLWFKDT